MPKRDLRVVNLGLVDYDRAWALQRRLAEAVQRGEAPETLLLLEHPHVFTIGRRGSRADVLLSDEEARRLGVAIRETDRGGQVTYHGPGQLVAYPVVNLRAWGGGPLRYVRTLERVVVGALSDLRVPAFTLEGLTGVWVRSPTTGQPEKICAIGVKISRGVTYHGLALNVNTDPKFFGLIVPCGIRDLGVTSLERLLGRRVDMDLVRYALVYRFSRDFGFAVREEDPAEALDISRG